MAHIREIMAVGVPNGLARMLGNNQLNTVVAGGVGQADATPLVINFALIRTPVAGQGVRLGCASGAAITALYNVGPAAVNLYPAEDETLNDQTPNLPLSVAAGQTALAVPSIDAWLVQIPPGGPSGGIPEAPSDGNAYGRYNASWAPVLEIAGGTLSGPLVLAGDPTVASGAATKRYVDNTAALLAPLASPAFSGTPTAPTAPSATSNSQIATAAFVKAQNYLSTLTLAGDVVGSGASPLAATVEGLQGRPVAGTAPLDGQVLGWSAANSNWQPLPAPPAAAGGSTGQLQWNEAGVLAGVTISGDATINTATGVLTLAAVNANIGTFQGLTLDGRGRVTAAANMNYAPLASPIFTGTPAAPTAAAADSSTTLATTAFVKAQGYQNVAQISAVYAPIASPIFTGTPTAPTAPSATSNSQIATTAFVKAQGYLIANQTITISGDISGSGATAIVTTLPNVNANVGTFQGITFNAKGQATAAINQGYWVADADWSFSAHTLIGNTTGSPPPTITGSGAALLQVVANGNASLLVDTFAGTSRFFGRSALGTAAAPTGLVSGTLIAQWCAGGYTSAGAYTGAVIGISAFAAETWSATAQGNYLDFFTTRPTTTVIVSGMRLNGDGGLSLPNSAADMGIGTVNAANGLYIGGNLVLQDTGWSFSAHNLLGTQNVSGNAVVVNQGIQYTVQDGNNGGFWARAFAASGVFVGTRADGTMAAPTALALNDLITFWGARGWTGSAYTANSAAIAMYAAEAWTTGANGTMITFQVTAPTTTTLTAQMSLGAGLQIGAPTGGYKGAGTLNATAVYANGTVLTSDARYKSNILPLTVDALALVGAIEAKSFKHVAPPLPERLGEDGVLPAMPDPAWWDRTWWGFIAGEVDAAIAATGEAWDGMITDAAGVQSLSYNDLIAVLWRAVQQLSAQVQGLNARLAA